MTYKPKDPAILWYTKDFLTEIQFMSMEDIGKLMVLRASFHQHGRLSEKQLKMLISDLSEDLNKLIKVDSKGFYFCEIVEYEAKKRREFKARKSEDGIKGNKVKSLMKELDVTKEEARTILEEREGVKFGSRKYVKSPSDSPSDTPSDRKKGNTIEDGSGNEVDIELSTLEEIFFKQENQIPITEKEEKILEKNGFNYVGQFDREIKNP